MARKSEGGYYDLHHSCPEREVVEDTFYGPRGPVPSIRCKKFGVRQDAHPTCWFLQVFDSKKGGKGEDDRSPWDA